LGGLHAGEVGVAGRLQGRSESEEFSLKLKNPHNFAARKLALKREKNDNVIVVDKHETNMIGWKKPSRIRRMEAQLNL
jgi:hypothetical protein